MVSPFTVKKARNEDSLMEMLLLTLVISDLPRS